MLNSEKETMILFNEAEETANVYTCNGRMKRRLRELSEVRGDDVKLIRSDDISVTYAVPKAWVKINPPRQLSDETIKKFRDNAYSRDWTGSRKKEK